MKRAFLKDWLLAVVLFAPAMAEEPREIQEIKPVNTKAGVTVSIQMTTDRSKAESFTVQALDGAGRVSCALPKDAQAPGTFRIGLLAKIDAEDALAAVEVATWRPAAEGENGTHELKALPGAPKRVETNTYCTIRPVFREDEGGRSLTGFEIAVLAGARPSKDKGEIDPTAGTEEGCGEEAEPEDKPIEYTKIVIDLPAQPSDQLRYGLLLKPVWKEKEEGKTLEAFDISLASMPLEKAEG